MSTGRLIARRLATAFVLGLTILGWVTAFYAVGDAKGVEERLASAEADLADAKATLSRDAEEMSASRQELAENQAAAGRLETVTAELTTAQGGLAELLLQVDAAKERLDGLRTEARERQALLNGTARNYVTISRARMRSGPTTSSEELAIVPPGAQLVALEVVEDGTWYKVGRVGFMYHKLLKPVASPEGQ